MNHGRGHCQKGACVQAGWKLFPCHPCNLLTVCLSAILLGTVPLPLIPIIHRTPCSWALFLSGILQPLCMWCFANPAVTIWLFPLWSRFSNLPKVGVPDSRSRGIGEWLAGMTWAESTWKALLYRNLPHLHILLIKASVELLHRG